MIFYVRFVHSDFVKTYFFKIAYFYQKNFILLRYKPLTLSLLIVHMYFYPRTCWYSSYQTVSARTNRTYFIIPLIFEKS